MFIALQISGGRGGGSVICEFCLVFMECSETWVEWNNCTQMDNLIKVHVGSKVNAEGWGSYTY